MENFLTPEKHRKWNRDYYKKNKEKIGEEHCVYYQKNKKRIKANMVEYRKRNPDFSKISNLRIFYGLTLDEYNQILIEQEWKCKICGIELIIKGPRVTQPHIDHDHKTKKIRGILCSNCNHLLGHGKDNIDIIKKAIIYLERNNYER
jgi:hypothetical protein